MKYIILIIVLLLSYDIIPTYFFKMKNKIRNLKIKKDKIIYLTFDDGPNKIYTKKLLDLLKKFNVKATFFTVATFVKNNHYIIDRMKNDGHTIAFHSYSHKNPWFKTYKQTKNEFINSKQIYDEEDIKIKYYRPSWGRFSIPSLILSKMFKYKIILWDVMAEDWKNTSEKTIENKLLKRIKNGSIICLHDNRGYKSAPLNTIKALENIIPILINKGYKFKKVDDLYE